MLKNDFEGDFPFKVINLQKKLKKIKKTLDFWGYRWYNKETEG